MTKQEIKQILKDNSKSLGDTIVIYETCYDDVVEDLYSLANSSNGIQNVISTMCPKCLNTGVIRDEDEGGETACSCHY